jgi:predicted acylesterase/phospholipase RssA
MNPSTALVLSGGGVFGAAQLGALHVLWFELYQTVRVVAGTSVGAIIGALLVLGHAPVDIMQALLHEQTQLIALDNWSVERFGLTSQENLRSFVERLILQKVPTVPTFAQVHDTFGVDLVVTGTNLTRHHAVYFHRHSFPDMSVLDALMISSCVPLVFPYIMFRNEIYVDGFVTDNFPFYETQNYLKQHYPFESFDVFGINLFKDIQPNRSDPSFQDYAMALFNTFIGSKTYPTTGVFQLHVHDKYNQLVANNSDIESMFYEGFRQFSLKERVFIKVRPSNLEGNTDNVDSLPKAC